MRISRKTGVVVLVLLAIGIVIAVALPRVSYLPDYQGDPREAEKDTIQAAMDAMMVDNSITEVEASVYPNQDWTSYPSVPGLGLVPLSDYLVKATTEYFYCWETTGWIRQQEESGPVRCSQQ